MGINSNLSSRIFQVQYRQYPYLLCGFSMPFRGIESIAANLPTPPQKKNGKNSGVWCFLARWFAGFPFGSIRDARKKAYKQTRRHGNRHGNRRRGAPGCIHCVSLSTSVKLSNSPSRGEEEIRKGVDLKEVEVEVSKGKKQKKQQQKTWKKLG